MSLNDRVKFSECHLGRGSGSTSGVEASSSRNRLEFNEYSSSLSFRH